MLWDSFSWISSDSMSEQFLKAAIQNEWRGAWSFFQAQLYPHLLSNHIRRLLGASLYNIWNRKLQRQHVNGNLTVGTYVPSCLVGLTECSANSLVNGAARSHYLLPLSIQHYPDACGFLDTSLTLHRLEIHHCLFPLFLLPSTSLYSFAEFSQLWDLTSNSQCCAVTGSTCQYERTNPCLSACSKPGSTAM